MSSKPQASPARSASNFRVFQRQKAKPGTRTLTSAAIRQDIAAFKKRGGRIEVLGNTPFRATAVSAFSSRRSAGRKKPPTPVADAGKSAT